MTKAVVLGAIAIALMLAACAGGSEPVAYKVCTRNDTWVRPTEEQMHETWNDPRYRWRSLEQRRAALSLSFYRYTGSPSLDVPVLDLAGLNSAGGFSQLPRTGECGAPRQQDMVVISGEAVEVWTMLYDVTAVERVGDGFRVHVTPIEKGYRALQFAQEMPDRRVHIIGPDGQELECFGPPSQGLRCE